jgi:hypothetical protein
VKVRPTPARQFRRTAQVELSCDRLIQHGQHPTTDGFNVTIRIQQKNPTTTKIQFVLPDDIHEGAVSAVGSFNQWQPGVHRLVKRSNGTRSVSVDVPKGEEIKFRYLGDGGVWFDDPDADVITNEGALVRA